MAMDAALLVMYLGLLGLAYWRARSLAWLVVSLAGAGAAAGALISFSVDRGYDFTRLELQWVLLATFLVVALAAWVPRLGFGSASSRRHGNTPSERSPWGLLAIILPVILLLAFVVLMTTQWTEQPAFIRPVSFLIGHGVAEDNAEWLDYAAQWATGNPISKAVPMGGPLQLVMTFIGTVMVVVSNALWGGLNEVAVATNTVVYSEFAMAVLVIFALAPFAEARLRNVRLPAPLVWSGALVLASAALVVINFGHLTLQYTLLVCALWSATFLSGLQVRRARLLASLAVIAAMTVWFPLAGVALVTGLVWLVVLVGRAVRAGWRSLDVPGLVLLGVVGLGTVGPIVSGLLYGLNLTAPVVAMGGSLRGVSARVAAGLQDSPLFTASGGTESASVILAVLAAVSVLAAAGFLAPIAGPLRSSLVRRFAPLILLGVFAAGIYALDFWATGGGPNYGSQKITFMLVVVALATAGPIALASLDSQSSGRTTQVQWIGLGVVALLLMVDSILPRAVAMLRPQQWSPPIPFNNTSGSYWYPADVRDTADQPIAGNPVACVYLPPGAIVPSAIVPSGLSDAQRVYNCTRLLAGLSGVDRDAQPIVEWIRREWLTNTTAWSPAYPVLSEMPDSVKARNIILLDEGSNVIGLESVQSLLDRFPQNVAE